MFRCKLDRLPINCLNRGCKKDLCSHEGVNCGGWAAVSLQDVASSSRGVTSGVPQGSVLGPILFLLYVNYLPSYITCKCKFFADDLKIYMEVRYETEAELANDMSVVQADIDKIVSVAASWGLKLNSTKCNVLRFMRGRASRIVGGFGGICEYHINNSNITFAQTCRDLGIMVDSELKFHAHIKSIVGKASGISSNILSSTLCRSPEFMVSIYIAHVRPLLEFSSCLWNVGYILDSKLLEGVQRRWTKQIDGLSEVPYHERLRRLNLYSVTGRLLRADMIKYWRIFHDESPLEPNDLFVLSPNVGTRGHRYKLSNIRPSLECQRRSFGNRRVALWNSLPDALVSLTSLDAFKKALHNRLGQLLFEFDL